MSSVFDTVFGGKKSTQTANSQNQAYPFIQNTFGGAAGNTGAADGMISSLLGMGGDSAASSAAMNNFANSGGMKFMMDQGTNAVNNNQATKGLFASGATGKELQNFGTGLGSTYMNQYLQNLFNLGGQGLQAGGLISGAGNVSNSSGSSSDKPGMGGFLGKLASGIAASDRALKEDIIRVGRLDNGLNVYSFRYKGEDGRNIGVMADEVANIQPEALGPMTDGHATVDYSKIEGWN